MAAKTDKATRRSREAEAEQRKTRVMAVDDHPIVRQGLRELVNGEPDMCVVAEAADAREAMAAAKEHRPELAVIDLTLKDMGGLELIKQLQAVQPELKVIVMSMHDEKLYAERALRAGAKGYLMKQEGTDKLIDGIRTVVRGGIFVSDKMASRMLGRYLGGKPELDARSPIERLSDREIEVFEMLGRGVGTRDIADKLCVSVKTVESHREHIKQKLKLASANELVQHATQWVLSEGSA